jgi:hypothetical protein
MRFQRSLATFSVLAGFLPAAEMTERPVPGSKITYADLLKRVFEEVKVDSKEPGAATASDSLPIRPLLGKDPAEALTGTVRIEGISRVGIRIPGRPQALVMFSVNPGEPDPDKVDLALFDIAGAPKLLDIVEAPSFPDDAGGLWPGDFLVLSDSADALVYESNHSNSSQGYQGLTVVAVRNAKVEPLLRIDLLSCDGCHSGSFTEKAAISTAPDPGSSYRKLIVKVTRELRRGGVKSSRTFAAEYRWDPAKGEYRPLSRDLEELAAFNEKNY